MSSPILATKLFIPGLRPKIVSRPHLITQLNRGLQGKLILISAPAGFGKTTLASEWISESGLAAAWLSLDDRDSDPIRFLTYFTAALQTVFPEMGKGVLAALQSPQPPSSESVLTSLINEISTAPRKFIFVLDDYHTIHTTAVSEAVQFLIEHQPQGMHLVIVTREDPPLPLARQRARGELTELRLVDLRFQPGEVAEFLNEVMRLNLSAEDISLLETRTEGWVTSLQLAALSLQGQTDPLQFIQSFSGSHHFVLDYLVQEVLEKQPGSTITFLLRTSVLDRLCGPLCDALLDTQSPSGLDSQGQATLEYLERANLFTVPLDHERRWYRYHHLFGNLLRQRLGQTLGEAEIAGLHIRASEWYEDNGWMLEAFQHAAAAHDIERAERLIESKNMGLHQRSVSNTILDWLESLPAALLDSRPLLRVRSATLALMAWRTAGVEEKIAAAERVLEKLEPDARNLDLLGQAACARATRALISYDPQTMLEQAHRAMQHLSPENFTYLFTANWALATANMLLGDRLAAKQACQQAVHYSQKATSLFSKILATTIQANLLKLDNQLQLSAEVFRTVIDLAGENPHPNTGTALLNLAEIYYEWNDLGACEALVRRSLELMRLYDNQIDRYILCEVLLARIELARGNPNRAAEILDGAELSARKHHFLLRLADIAAVQVSVQISLGRLEDAAALANRYTLPISQARTAIEQGEPARALRILEPASQTAQDRSWPDELLKITVLQSIALSANGNLGEAKQMLSNALVLAEPGRFVRLFLDEGDRMHALLEAAARNGIQPEAAGRLLNAFQAESGQQRSAPQAERPGDPLTDLLTDLLTARELDVLRLIALGLSNQEIGDRLFLALDTVKGHNRRIFEKLQVHRRTEAIARARELGLILA